jgi:hypothetical protein
MAKEIKIVIERRKVKLVQHQQSFAGHLSPKGIIERARETEYLPRRLQNKNIIRIRDGGYYLTDDLAFFTNPVSQLVTETTTYIEWEKTGTGSVPPNPVELATASAPGLNDYAEAIAANSIRDYKNVSEQIETFAPEFAEFAQNGGSYPLPFYAQVYGDSFAYVVTDSLLPEDDPYHSTKWTPEGLKLSPAELAEPIYIDGEYRSFQLSGEGHNKITQTAVFDDPDAGFVPTGEIDIVFVPKLLAVHVLAIYQKDVLTDPQAMVNASGLSLVNPLRARRYEKDQLNAIIPASLATNYYTRWKRGGVGEDADAYNAAYHRFQIVGADGGILTPSSAFPVPPGDPFANPDIFPTLMLIAEDYPDEPEEPFIIAIIKKDDVLYYVWNQ